MRTPALRVCTGAALLIVAAGDASAQRRAWHEQPRTFRLFVENDAFIDSDSGYTNGIRAEWSLLRDPGKPERLLAKAGLHSLLVAVGMIEASPRRGCRPEASRDDHRTKGPCSMLDIGIGQTMYTPNDLIDAAMQLDDRPWAGFLFGAVGVTLLDSPVERKKEGADGISLLQLSNQITVGITGPAARARDTQSFAHWALGWGAARPLGWHNQIDQMIQAAVITTIAGRPTFTEWCAGPARRRCSGAPQDVRLVDITPSVEAVFGTYMRRASIGTVARFGWRFPDAMQVQRIGTTKAESAAPTGRRWWTFGFIGVDGRYVQHNTFIEGGLADQDPGEWAEVRLIDRIPRVGELSFGAAFGNSRMTLVAQVAHRTPEYKVRAGPTPEREHRYASVTFAMHTPAKR